MTVSMDISGLNSISPTLGVTQPALTSSRIKTTEDIKNSYPAQTRTDETAKITKELNDEIDHLQTSLGFLLNEKLSDQMVSVIKDKKTGELIRLIPSEEQLKIKKIMTVSTGLLLDQIV